MAEPVRRVRRGVTAVFWNPLEPPFERTDDAIGCGRGEPAFPGVEEPLQHRVSCYTAAPMQFIVHTRKHGGRKRAGRAGVRMLER